MTKATASSAFLSGSGGLMFQNNKVNIVISILAAIALWAYVVTYINPTTTRSIPNVPVELINLDALADDGLTVSAGQNFTVDLIIEGRRTDLTGLAVEDFQAIMDMKGFSIGTNAVPVRVTMPDKVNLAEVRPARIEVQIEELISVMKPIKISYSETFEDKTEPGFVTLAPQEIEVTGAKEQVNNVAYIMAEVNSDEIKETETTLTVAAIPVTESGEEVTDIALSQESIAITATLCKVKEVPLNISIIGSPPEDRRVTRMDIPKTIFIRGSANALSGITGVAGREIDISGIGETMIITPELQLPAGVELADRSRKLSVTVEIEGIETKAFTYSSDKIEIRGLPDGCTAHVNTGNILATVYGTKAQIAGIDAADITPYVDLVAIGATVGAVDIPVNFEIAKEIVRIEALPANVRVTVIEVSNPGVIETTNSAVSSASIAGVTQGASYSAPLRSNRFGAAFDRWSDVTQASGRLRDQLSKGDAPFMEGQRDARFLKLPYLRGLFPAGLDNTGG
jgi:YbbR domain-containing protein